MDEGSNISKARLAWCTRLGVRFGIYDYYESVLKPLRLCCSEKSKYFDDNLVTPLFIDGFATWDETHRKVQPGSASKNGMVITKRTFTCKLPKDENGKLDCKNGNYVEANVV